jgi:hypothetical protein
MFSNASDLSSAPQQTHGLHLAALLGKPADLAHHPRIRGGLPPRALRRVREYIEAHLGETISIDALAGIVGLSVPLRSRIQAFGGCNPAPLSTAMPRAACARASDRYGPGVVRDRARIRVFRSKPLCASVPRARRYHSEQLSLVYAVGQFSHRGECHEVRHVPQRAVLAHVYARACI